MTASSFTTSTAGWLPAAAGAAGLLGLVTLVLFFTAGQPFGTLNDLSIGLAAVLSAVLAWAAYPDLHARYPLLSQAALAAAWLGALLIVIGAGLVISTTTGWFLAGMYMSAGYALIGSWLLVLNIAVLRGGAWPHGLVILGLVSGVVMLLGLVTIPAIFSRVDSMESATWLVKTVGQAGWLGSLVLYPLWCLLLGRTFLMG